MGLALPLEAINKEPSREKSIRHGHPSTLRLWWAKRPLAAARAVIWASLVDDPSAHPDKFPNEEDQIRERNRLFKILEQLVIWENSNNREILDEAYKEVLKSTNGQPPAILDPFAGGGIIPMEGQRLGLTAYAHDLNLVAVMINKATIEIPSIFAGNAPVNPPAQEGFGLKSGYDRCAGLVEDVNYYGERMRTMAYKELGHMYPKVKISKEQGGGEATAVAWIWAHTVKCPYLACGCEMPLEKGFTLSKKRETKPMLNLYLIIRSRQRSEFSIASKSPQPTSSTAASRRAATSGTRREEARRSRRSRPHSSRRSFRISTRCRSS